MLHLVVTSLNPPFIYNGSSIQPSAEHWVMLLRSPWLVDQHWELMRDAVSGSPLPPALLHQDPHLTECPGDLGLSVSV